VTDRTGDAQSGSQSPAPPANARGAGQLPDAGAHLAPGQPADGEVGERSGSPQTLAASLEAILLVVDEPVADVVLAQVLERSQPEVRATLEVLSQQYRQQGRGFELRQVAGGWRLYTSPDYAAVVERFVLDGQQARLTQAALETLAVVAYRQPVSRSRVSAVRGVNVDGVMRTLLTRGLVEECGTDADSGALLYRTTSFFLERLGLSSVDELPPLAPYLPDIETLDIDSVSPSS
jgi:segregation and condensation protein B